MVKSYFVVLLILVIILLISTNVYSLGLHELNESQCIEGNGVWVTPTIISDDPEGKGNIPKPFCKCTESSEWNGSKCIMVSNKLLCERSGGQWNITNCICPEDKTGVGWYKFKEGTGCVRVLPSDVLLKKDIETDKTNSVNTYSITFAIIILITAIVILISLKRYQK